MVRNKHWTWVNASHRRRLVFFCSLYVESTEHSCCLKAASCCFPLQLCDAKIHSLLYLFLLFPNDSRLFLYRQTCPLTRRLQDSLSTGNDAYFYTFMTPTQNYRRSSSWHRLEFFPRTDLLTVTFVIKWRLSFMNVFSFTDSRRYPAFPGCFPSGWNWATKSFGWVRVIPLDLTEEKKEVQCFILSHIRRRTGRLETWHIYYIIKHKCEVGFE